MSKALLTTCLFLFLVIKADAQNAMVSWKKIRQISFQDVTGKSIQLTDNAPAVFVMLSPECPLCRNYAPVLNELSKQYPDVAFYSVFPGKAYGIKEISQYQKEYQLLLKVLIDPAKKLSSYLKASTTPECIFIDKLGVIAYHGMIDNWPASLGQKRKVITEKYLATALAQQKSGKAITIKQTKPIGCLINDL
ncbi:redoxin domain-containing protein [Pedobacter frigoris]|uniref:Redoxin domain-containing protein n=1 Tax=Pedobacter frigoris TaxID=2571272 RepID=A0A4U1CCL9_9SPHI|nr:redoxin domain-containing protein [Pedobacter frigoris]TKC03728.1 redoxin domain-containing protein [Pedobacter frigoris]